MFDKQVGLSPASSQPNQAMEWAEKGKILMEFLPLLKEANKPTIDLVLEGLTHIAAEGSENFPTPKDEPASARVIKRFLPKSMVPYVEKASLVIDAALYSGIVNEEQMGAIIKQPGPLISGLMGAAKQSLERGKTNQLPAVSDPASELRGEDSNNKE